MSFYSITCNDGATDHKDCGANVLPWSYHSRPVQKHKFSKIQNANRMPGDGSTSSCVILLGRARVRKRAVRAEDWLFFLDRGENAWEQAIHPGCGCLREPCCGEIIWFLVAWLMIIRLHDGSRLPGMELHGQSEIQARRMGQQ